MISVRNEWYGEWVQRCEDSNLLFTTSKNENSGRLVETLTGLLGCIGEHDHWSVLYVAGGRLFYGCCIRAFIHGKLMDFDLNFL